MDAVQDLQLSEFTLSPEISPDYHFQSAPPGGRQAESE
jgi:hypothetical protein